MALWSANCRYYNAMPVTYENYFEMMKVGFICWAGVGAATGVLFARWWVGVVVALVLFAYFFTGFWISVIVGAWIYVLAELGGRLISWWNTGKAP